MPSSINWLRSQHLCPLSLTFACWGAWKGCPFPSNPWTHAFKCLVRHCSIATRCRPADQPLFALLFFLLSIWARRWTTQGKTLDYINVNANPCPGLICDSDPGFGTVLESIQFNIDRNGHPTSNPGANSDRVPSPTPDHLSIWRSSSRNRFSFSKAYDMYMCTSSNHYSKELLYRKYAC